MYKIWVGKRESDILTYNEFDCSITFYGTNQKNNYAFCNWNRVLTSYNNQFEDFVIEHLQKKISEKHEVKIHFYNSTFAYRIISRQPDLANYIVNLNPLAILNLLNHKTISRLWLSNTVNVPAFSLLSKPECTISNLRKKFIGYSSFVIQKNISGGGTGTYIINQNNEETIMRALTEDELYLISPYYYPTKSLSCHAMIGNDKIAVFPVSIQLINTKNNHIQYVGNKYKSIDSSTIEKTKYIAEKVCKRIQAIGYRGICGFDFIHCNNQIMLVEINPRYQGSSYVINLALKEHNAPSLFEINTICFEKKLPDDLVLIMNELNIGYDNKYVFFNDRKDLELAVSLRKNKNIIIFSDGYNNCSSFVQGSYLFRYLIPN